MYANLIVQHDGALQVARACPMVKCLLPLFVHASLVLLILSLPRKKCWAMVGCGCHMLAIRFGAYQIYNECNINKGAVIIVFMFYNILCWTASGHSSYQQNQSSVQRLPHAKRLELLNLWHQTTTQQDAPMGHTFKMTRSCRVLHIKSRVLS